MTYLNSLLSLPPILLLLAWIHYCSAYPYKLPCNRDMTVGSLLMGNPAKFYDIRDVQVLRSGETLESGSQFTPGEKLTVQISTIKSTTGGFKFMFQATGGAQFTTGNVMCDGTREYNLGDGTLGSTELLMPTTTNNTKVTIWVAWATQYGHVYISKNFTLINFPVTQTPSLSPHFKSASPTLVPSKIPFIKVPTVDTSPKLHFVDETQQNFTLVLKREKLPGHFGKSFVTVNGTVPGPTLRAQVGQWINVNVINEIGSEMSAVHWHGFDQKSTPWNDGPPGVTQCPINTMNGTKLLSSINTVTQLNYKFFADRTGTYWYHGHYNSQYPEGLYGAVIVEDDTATTDSYSALGATYSQETELMISDFYLDNTEKLLHNYMSPASGGLEPVPDYIAVNNMFTKTMQISVNRKQKVRLRVINAASLSMYDISVDGCPLKVIEVDGTPLKPQVFSSVRLDVGQRISFILDWATCDAKFANAANIPLKVKAVKEMYRQYDQTDAANYGLLGSTTKAKFLTIWVGQFVFASTDSDPDLSYYYYGSSIPTKSNAPIPVEPNMLQMSPLFYKPVPPLDLEMDYNMTFSKDPSTNVFKFFINGASYQDRSISSPLLYDYMMPQGGPLNEVDIPKNSKITGDGKNPFVIPYNRSITVTIRNGDGQGHPIHMHGHNFWVIATSQYTPTNPIMRDTISVPAQGWAKIRFMSDNPGVWLLHCHIDWHMYNGFMATMVEAPSMINNTISNLPSDHKDACSQYFAPTITPVVQPSIEPSISLEPTFEPSGKPSYAPVAQIESSDPYAMDWKTWGYDTMRRGYNQMETKIKTTTLSKLSATWTYKLAGAVYMQPLIVLNYDFGNSLKRQSSRKTTTSPTVEPSNLSTTEPSTSPTVEPSNLSTTEPSPLPTVDPSNLSTTEPSPSPTVEPSNLSTVEPSASSTTEPSISSTTLSTIGVKDLELESSRLRRNREDKLLEDSDSTRPSPVKYTYLGCYADSASRALDKSLGGVTSVQDCYSLAVINKLQYFGIQIGSRCWGSSNYTKATKYRQLPSAQCATPCTVSREKCGGYYVNVLYVVGQATFQTIQTEAPTKAPVFPPSAAPSTTSWPTVMPTYNPTSVKYSYLGCYGDSISSRALDFYLSNFVRSVQECYTLAIAKKMKYFGLQSGMRCYGSVNYAKSTKYNLLASDQCKMPCVSTGLFYID